MTVTEITFGEYNQSEFGILPAGVTISPPAVKTYTVSVPGRDQVLDYTESLDGLVHYENRTITMEMQCFAEDEEYASLEHKCRNLLHGKKMSIQFDSDPGYYYLGRLSVDWRSEPNIDTASITADCDPYKYKTEKTVVESDVAGSTQVTLTNEGMPAVPKITADAQMQLVFTLDGTEHTVTVGAGTQLAPDLLLQAGTYEITVNGTGHVKFEYQEGAL